MSWLYIQTTGELIRNGQTAGTGYSGNGMTPATGRNNPALEFIRNVGPIPAGRYEIGPAHNSPNTGPKTMNLTPVGHDAYLRTDFRMHGNNATNNASEGCIIMPPDVRQQVIDSNDTDLIVVPRAPDAVEKTLDFLAPTPTPDAQPVPLS